MWAAGWQLVCRVQRRDRWVRPTRGGGAIPRDELARRLVPLARVEPELVVQKVGQPRAKRQPVTATIAATPRVVRVQAEGRTRPAGAITDHDAWLVEVAVARVASAPWWLLADHPVATAAQATEVFRMYRERWAIADVLKVGTQCLGWEAVQVLDAEAVRFRWVGGRWGGRGAVAAGRRGGAGESPAGQDRVGAGAAPAVGAVRHRGDPGRRGAASRRLTPADRRLARPSALRLSNVRMSGDASVGRAVSRPGVRLVSSPNTLLGPRSSRPSAGFVVVARRL